MRFSTFVGANCSLLREGAATNWFSHKGRRKAMSFGVKPCICILFVCFFLLLVWRMVFQIHTADCEWFWGTQVLLLVYDLHLDVSVRAILPTMLHLLLEVADWHYQADVFSRISWLYRFPKLCIKKADGKWWASPVILDTTRPWEEESNAVS